MTINVVNLKGIITMRFALKWSEQPYARMVLVVTASAWHVDGPAQCSDAEGWLYLF